MESLLPLGGFQLPFQQRLTRLYNDTKKSASDFVKEPVQNEEDPEIKALHRKLRIQKDRLVSWGVEWSESAQKDEIDESLSKAGLSEVVGSIMSTIRDILAEAEPLWLASKRIADGNRSTPDRKAPLVQWDKSRFEDLVHDLTASIDTLYDVSRTRSMGAAARRPTKTSYKSPGADDYRAFEPSRMQTPQVIQPDTLTHLRPKHQDIAPSARGVVLMSKMAYSELTKGTTREQWAPLLLEYAPFDPIYSVTGILPPMSRFEKLSSGLQREPQRSPATWTGLPRLLGYFEDIEKSRFGMVYRFPSSFNAVSIERQTQRTEYNLTTLDTIVGRPEYEPKLEAKFRLAHNLTNTIFDMHARGITHGNLVAANVSFCDIPSKEAGSSEGQVDVRRPLISSFDVFPEDSANPSETTSHLSSDRRPSQGSPLSMARDERVSDLYSLATMLLSVGLWTPLDKLLPDSTYGAIPDTLLDQLSLRCGTLYRNAVQACWNAVETEMKGESTGDSLISSVQAKASRMLEACCILDDVSGFEERSAPAVRAEQAPVPPAPRKPSVASPLPKSTSMDLRDVKSPAPAPELAPRSEPAPSHAETADTQLDGEFSYAKPVMSLRKLTFSDAASRDAESKERVKLYPNVPLAPEAVDKWNAILMPQINHALRHFYRKNPESVEISLESVGPAPNRTKPTVLVVCTSVGKVRAILKKRVGDLFDHSTGFSLKVCRGHVLRSRRRSLPAFRSMAHRSHVGESFDKTIHSDDEEVEAINPKHQEKPGNGASIGAWIGDRHLPPVSFGGLVLVDDKAYGMTVHHMLDDPETAFGQEETARSSALPGREWFTESYDENSPEDDAEDDEGAYELSDTESEAYSDSDITSDWGDDEDEEDEFEPGDTPGIEPGCGDGYIVTQPALDDVEEGFYPSLDTEDEDHLDTFGLGEIYASSGIRRKQLNGLTHEVDWALFEFNDDRLPSDNYIPRAGGKNIARRPTTKYDDQQIVRPTTVAPSSALPGMQVQCVARTSGLQTGHILPTLTSVKIYGRTSPSHTYQVASMATGGPIDSSSAAMGIPGDSGAWVVDRHNGQLCGHILAWSQRKRVAYICPMDVLLLDIAQTLEASHVKLPGGEAVVSLEDDETSPCRAALGAMELESSQDQSLASASEDEDDDVTAPALVISNSSSKSASAHSLHSMTSRSRGDDQSSNPLRVSSRSDLSVLNGSMNDLRVSRGIDVSG